MAISNGTRLGPYEIAGPIGAGGMGEVYKARDTRLDRTVAIKVLPAILAADPEFRERFTREARAISALEHPNICALYDVGRESGTDFLVMQYLGGETLAERLSRGSLPVPEALKIAIEIASALDRAHTAGIAHRDLKPGNVMLARNSGGGGPHVRLLDFGLAKDVPAAGAAVIGATAPLTVSAPLTARGSIVGTFQYMAPEQIEADEADARADIWAFGCVLYEMLAGKPAFEGKSHSSLIGAILKDDPPRIEMQPVAPPALDHTVRRCLAKNRDERWQHIRDVRSQLAWIADGLGRVELSRTGASTSYLALAAAALIGAALIGSAVWMLRPAGAPEPQITRFTIAPPPGTTMRGPWEPAVSHDGSHIVLAAIELASGQSRLYVRALNQLTMTPIAGTDGADEPFFAPDGDSVAFFANGKLKKVPVAGGEPITIADAPEPRGGTWTRDGRIVFAATAYAPLSVVSSDGGLVRRLTAIDPAQNEVSHRLPRTLPDGGIVFTVLTDDVARPFAAITSASGGAHRKILDRATSVEPAAGGYLLYAIPRRTAPLSAADLHDRDSLAAVRFVNGTPEGEPIPIGRDVAGVDVWGVTSFAAGGHTLVTAMQSDPPARRLAWVGPADVRTPIGLPLRPYQDARLSPDGRSIAAVVRTDAENVWLGSLTRGVLEKLTDEVTDVAGAVWSPDGRSLLLSGEYQGKPEIVRVPVDNPARIELAAPGVVAKPTSWRGTTVAVEQLSMIRRTDVSILTLGAPAGLHAVAATAAPESGGRLSPDGTWIAYRAAQDIYLQRTSGEGRPVRLTPDGGETALWSPDGRTVYYQHTNSIFAVPFASGEVGRPGRVADVPGGRMQDISGDGQKLLVLFEEEDQRPAQTLTVAVGWLDSILSRARPGK